MPSSAEIALAVLAFFVSLALSAAWRRLALRRRWFDLPGERRLHAVPTPRGGGVGIAVALLLAAPGLGPGWPLFATGLAVTAGAGLVDDLRALRALPKFLLQSLGAVPLALAWPLAPEVLGPGFATLAAWSVTLVLVNFWNFMDGSNGLAASQALLAGLGLALLAGLGTPVAWLGLALAGACLGFLPFNLPQARLFLGDVGSHALGYAVAALLLSALRQDAGLAGAALLLVSAFLVDAGLTLATRMLRGRKFWLAHREHLYQRAVAHGWSHPGICAAYAGWTLAAGALAAVAGGPGTVVAAYAAGILLYWTAGRRWRRQDENMESLG